MGKGDRKTSIGKRFNHSFGVKRPSKEVKRKKTKNMVSFLIGSGFSIPEGLPKVGDINKRLSDIKYDEIYIASDLRVYFVDKNNDPNSSINLGERLFIQEFFKFYNKEILKGAEFHYEDFYDFYKGYLDKGSSYEKAGLIDNFFNSFPNEIVNIEDENGMLYEEKIVNALFDKNRNCYNRISDFNTSFNQLLASLLYKEKYIETERISNYQQYDDFICFLSILLKEHTLKIHTLNHDLFFDYLGHNHIKLNKRFADGFSRQDSNFYLEVNDKDKGLKRMQLEKFSNKFDKPLCLFKLHGSISNRILYVRKSNQQTVKVEDIYAESRYYQNDDVQIDEISPDFLSGTTNKVKHYNNPFYAPLFDHFKRNLSKSKVLVVIGYGFKDEGINAYLEKYFLSKGKKIIVIDPYKPNAHFLSKYNVEYIEKGITDVSASDFNKIHHNII